MAERKLSRPSASCTWRRWANSTQTRGHRDWQMGKGKEKGPTNETASFKLYDNLATV